MLSIYEIYIAPLQGNYILKGAPSPGSGENKGLKELEKQTGQFPRKRTELRWETVPCRGAHNREGPMLFNGRVSMRYHKITSGGRAERFSARARRCKGAEGK